MKEIALHLLDLAEYSVSAHAKNVCIDVREDFRVNQLVTVVEEHGDGMTEEVARQVIDYGLFVRSGGFILFHDTLPSQQHVMTNRWVHGNEDRPIHRTAVRDALMLLEWPNDKWKLVMDEYDLNAEIGGMMVFQRQ